MVQELYSSYGFGVLVSTTSLCFALFSCACTWHFLSMCREQPDESTVPRKQQPQLRQRKQQLRWWITLSLVGCFVSSVLCFAMFPAAQDDLSGPRGVLGVSADATPDEIRKAFRKLSLQMHPDKHLSEDGVAPPEVVARFAKLEAARGALLRDDDAPIDSSSHLEMVYGVGLPPWLVDPNNLALVSMGYMFLLLGVGLGFYVAVRWTRGSEKATQPKTARRLTRKEKEAEAKEAKEGVGAEDVEIESTWRGLAPIRARLSKLLRTVAYVAAVVVSVSLADHGGWVETLWRLVCRDDDKCGRVQGFTTAQYWGWEELSASRRKLNDPARWNNHFLYKPIHGHDLPGSVKQRHAYLTGQDTLLLPSV